MTKFLRIALLLLYLPAVLGVSARAHYCGGELESVKFFSVQPQGCCCGEDMASDCCKDEWSLVKLDENSHDAGIQHFSELSTTTQAWLIPVVPSLAIEVASIDAVCFSIDTGPPLRQNVPVYLRCLHLLI